MRSDEAVHLSAGSIDVEVDPVAGGRLAQITVGTTPLLVGRADASDPMRWGAYPMVPWAGRIRHGRFEFDGASYQLPLDAPPHAIHGFGYTSSWIVADHTSSVVRLELTLPSDNSWPFGGRVVQTIAVDPGGVTLAMSALAESHSFPVALGWHPWFRKPSHFDFRPTAMYRRDDDHLAVDELVDASPGPWDDCFVNHEPVRLRIDDVEVVMSSPCRDWVVYDEPEHATCIEPQTAPPDAFNHDPAIATRGDAVHATARLSCARAMHVASSFSQ